MKNILYVIITLLAIIAFETGCKKNNHLDPADTIEDGLINGVNDSLNAIATQDSLEAIQATLDSLAAIAAAADSIATAAAQALQDGSPIPDPMQSIDPPQVYNTTTETDPTDPNTICTVQTIQYAPEIGEQFLYDPTSDIMWVGNLLVYESILDGGYTPIVIENRASIVISASLFAAGDPVSIEIESSSLSAYREAISQLLGQASSAVNVGEMSYSIEEVYSEEHLRVMLSAGLEVGKWFDIAASYNFNDQSVTSRVIVKMVQPYYSIDMDIPASISSWFNEPENVNPEQFGGTSPVYISSIKYGRMILFMLESSREVEEVKSALNAGLNVWRISGSFNLETEDREVLEQSNIKSLVIGGSGTDAVSATSVEGVAQYIENGGEFSIDSPGAPLAYTLRFLADNSIAKVVLSSEYQVRNCITTEEPVEPEILSVTPFDGEPAYMCYFHASGNKRLGLLPIFQVETQLVTIGSDIYARITGEIHSLEINTGTARGTLDEFIHLYSVPDDYIFLGIKSDVYSSAFYIDDDEDDFDYPEVYGGLINSFEAVTQTDGRDLPCESDAMITNPFWRSHLRVYFNPLELRVLRIE